MRKFGSSVNPGAVFARIRNSVAVGLLGLFIIVITSTTVSAISPSAFWMLSAQPTTGMLHIHFIDVGQGDSILIQSPDGATALIDGGEDNGAALGYLQRLGAQQIATIIATHPHSDHIGGLADVMDAIPVGGVWLSGATNDTDTFDRFLETIDVRQIPVHLAETGDTIPLGGLEFEVLHSSEAADELNNTSIVLMLHFGNQSFLFTGDAEAPVEAMLLGTMRDQLHANVLKLGHHGSHSSSTPAFLAAVMPQFAIYSAGEDNQFRHPHPETIASLANLGISVYGTDRHGTVIVSTDGQSLDVETEEDVPPVVGGVTPTPAEGATEEPQITVEPDRDCSDFASQAEAQAFFEAAGGLALDVHRLDTDNDGTVCESLDD